MVSGVLTTYKVFGLEKKDSLVVLHGWGRDHLDWLGVGKFLASYYKVYLLDLPGFGATSLPENIVLGTWEYADFVEKFCKKQEIVKPVILGHSLGGRIGIILATRPDMLKKLVLVSSAGIEERSLFVRAKVILANVIRIFFPQRVFELLKSKIGSEDYRGTNNQMKQVLTKIVNEDLRYMLPKIMCQTLVIWGEKDNVLDVRYGKIFRGEIPRASLRIVWGAGHHPHLDQPREFLEILEEELRVD